jgi:hypothetical protein
MSVVYETGIPIEIFKSEIPESLKCAICMNVVDPPVKTKCSHIFCKKCIYEWVSVNPTCPVDRTPLSIKEVIQIDDFVKRLIGDFKVKCIEKDCKWEGQCSNWKDHLLKQHNKQLIEEKVKIDDSNSE